MLTVSVLIGNSDDKLSQAEWAQFMCLVGRFVSDKAKHVHFAGHSDPACIWQNACWVFEISTSDIQELKETLIKVKEKYRQDSIAFVLGAAELI